MTYNDFIQSIINTRGQWNILEGEYFESHHIIPKCMGGTGRKKTKNKNIIWLYADEHFIAHKLLALENPNNHSIVAAWRIMCKCTGAKNNKRFYEVTPEDYKICRELWNNLHSKFMIEESIKNKELGIGIFSEEAKKKSSQSRIGIKRPASEHRKKAVGAANKNRTYFNNGVVNVFTFECPEGFVSGRIINYDDSNRLKIIKEKQYKKVICLDTGVIYNSIKEATEKTGATHIGDCCKGKINVSGGLHWAFYSGEDRSELVNET